MLNEHTTIKDRYSLIRLLGRGGFSEVWLASDKFTSTQVALKIYAPGTGLDSEGIQLFTKEFSLVFDLNHTNLLKPTHYDCFENMPFLILPYCEKGSCSKLIGKMTEKEAWYFLHDVSCGLDYLHSQNPPIIHQDIKPDNILIAGNRRFMITDFGISTRIKSTLRKSVSKAFSSGGTLAYMAPERFGEDTTPIIANDIYSLGATVFELLTGDAPFGDHGGLLQKNGAAIPIIKGAYSKELKDLIYQCLSPKPWERPTDRQISDCAKLAMDGKPVKLQKTPEKKINRQLISKTLAGVVIAFVIGWAVNFFLRSTGTEKDNSETIYAEYVHLIQKGDSLTLEGEKEGNRYEQEFVNALAMYRKAQQNEGKINKNYASFNAQQKIDKVEKLIRKAYNSFKEKEAKMRQYNEYDAAAAFAKRAEALEEVNE
jgi:serine/threonine protein kinase